MSWKQRQTLGEEFVADVYDLLKIDDTYLLDTGDGFVYWGGDFATTVRTDMGVFRQSYSVYRVTAETDFLKGRGHLKELAVALEHEMDQCTFSGPVYDQPSDTFRLFCGVYATNDQEWLKRTFASAVALQMSQAHEMARRLSALFHATLATSAHPHVGFRVEPDPLIADPGRGTLTSGDPQSVWTTDPSWQQAGWVMEREARRFELLPGSGLRAEFDWVCGGQDSMVLEIRTDEPHPVLGHGLHVTLSVPMHLSVDAIGHLVLDLNTYEKTEYKRCHTLGSWCGHQGKLAFREFVPNGLYAPEYLEEVCVNMCTRAIWTNEWFWDMKCKAQQAAQSAAQAQS
ncbi:MAG: hypothetical protein JST30_17070 [Armatimonadetes bacterium]|nr:hypothetical protein [Armatimonadota bacterium]